MEQKTIIISLGGSLIVPNGGIDTAFLKKFRKVIEKFVSKNNRVVIVCGGGSITRSYQTGALRLNASVKDSDLDWIGIFITRVNAQLVRSLFGKKAHAHIIENPEYVKNARENIIIASGWKPGWSTDYVSAKCAQVLGSNEIINLSNINFIYDKDPKKYPDAKKFLTLSWKEMRNIVGNKWRPGAHTPFDPIATKLSSHLGLRVVFLAGDGLKNLEEYLFHSKINGSLIQP